VVNGEKATEVGPSAFFFLLLAKLIIANEITMCVCSAPHWPFYHRCITRN